MYAAYAQRHSSYDKHKPRDTFEVNASFSCSSQIAPTDNQIDARLLRCDFCVCVHFVVVKSFTRMCLQDVSNIDVFCIADQSICHTLILLQCFIDIAALCSYHHLQKEQKNNYYI